jgi:uncharacterized membrane protein YbhN (UPF0104 family)
VNQTRLRQLLTRLSSVLGIAIGLAGIAFVVKTLVSKWDEVSDAFRAIDTAPLVGSWILGLLAMTSIGFLWVSMISQKGHAVPARRAMSWYFTGQLGKYVPGGIWPIVGRAELATRNGVPRMDAYASTGLSLVTTYLGAVLALALGAVFTDGRWPITVIVAALGISGFALFSNQTLRARIISLVTKISPNSQTLTDPRRVVTLAITHIPSWIFMSLSTSVTASAFGAKVGIMEMLFITSTSWFVGFVVIGVPGGIGVREAVFTSLAGPIVGTPVAVSLALMSRVVFIVVDLSGALLSTVVAKLSSSAKT